MNSWQWYVSQFPESMFLCNKEHNDEYISHIIRGKNIAEQSNVLICGIARNCEKILPYTIARIERLGSFFNTYNVYIYENDSIDETTSILQKWSQENNKVVTEHEIIKPQEFTDPKGKIRMKYMAMARNKYLAYAKKFIKKNHIDYLIIVDCDLAGGWSYHGILNSLGQNEKWNAVGSNSIYYANINDKWKRLFYDTFAFRNINSWNEINSIEANNYTFNIGESLISVNSCFGGLCIYKPNFLKKRIWYTDEDCDHVTFHKKLIDKYKYNVFLNPSQVVLYNKHIFICDDNIKVNNLDIQSKEIIINCDTHGIGDNITMSWICEGARNSNIDIKIYASGEKRKLLNILNQPLVDKNEYMIDLSNLFTHDQREIKHNNISRVKSWLKFLNLQDVIPQKPSYNISKLDLQFAKDRCNDNTIVLCPESIRPHREWPKIYWKELAEKLRKDNFNVLIVCIHGLFFKDDPGLISNVSLGKIFALFSQVKLVVGCDSAPIHIAGVTETPALALLGPTTKHVFEHLPLVKTLSMSKNDISCTGCWFHNEYIHNPCDFGCISLCCITPDIVYNKIKEELLNVKNS